MYREQSFPHIQKVVTLLPSSAFHLRTLILHSYTSLPASAWACFEEQKHEKVSHWYSVLFNCLEVGNSVCVYVCVCGQLQKQCNSLGG